MDVQYVFQLPPGFFQSQNTQMIAFGKTEMPTHLQTKASALAAHIEPGSILIHECS